MEKNTPLFNLDISIIQPAKHNCSKTIQNMVIANGKYSVACGDRTTFPYRKYVIHFNTKNYHDILYMYVRSISCENEFPYFLVIFF